MHAKQTALIIIQRYPRNEATKQAAVMRTAERDSLTMASKSIAHETNCPR